MPADTQKRKYIGVMFECCKIYSRIYINRDRTAYTGGCPKCLAKVTVKIGPGGTEQRFFTAR